MNFQEAKETLRQILTDTVISAVKAYVKKYNISFGGEDVCDERDTSVITAWYDPQEYNSFEFVKKYKVAGSSIMQEFIPCVTIKYNGVNDYSLNVPCADGIHNPLFFSKNSAMFYRNNVQDGKTAYVIYDEEVFANKECKDFLLQFMEDTFPEYEEKIEELFGYFQ